MFWNLAFLPLISGLLYKGRLSCPQPGETGMRHENAFSQVTLESLLRSPRTA